MKIMERPRWLLGPAVLASVVVALVVVVLVANTATRTNELDAAERALAEAGIDVSRTEIGAEALLGCGPVNGTAIYDYVAGSGYPSEYEAVVRFTANALQRSELDRPAGILAPGPEESQWVFVAHDGSQQLAYRLSEFDGRFVVGTTSPC